MIIYAILRFCQIGWYRLQVLSIAKKAGFVLEVISLSYSSHAVQGL